MFASLLHLFDLYIYIVYSYKNKVAKYNKFVKYGGPPRSPVKWCSIGQTTPVPAEPWGRSHVWNPDPMGTSVKHQGFREINSKLQSVCHLLWHISAAKIQRAQVNRFPSGIAIAPCWKPWCWLLLLATPDPLAVVDCISCGRIGRNISNFRWPCVRSDVLSLKLRSCKAISWLTWWSCFFW